MERPTRAPRGDRRHAPENRLVHLELHTPNSPRACAFYTAVLAWEVERVRSSLGSYLAVGIGDGIEAGIVEAEGQRAFWLPYIRVADVAAATEVATHLGAAVLLPPREGPAGWRAVVAAHDSGPVAFWRPKP